MVCLNKVSAFESALELEAGPPGLRADSLPLYSGGGKFWDKVRSLAFVVKKKLILTDQPDFVYNVQTDA